VNTQVVNNVHSIPSRATNDEDSLGFNEQLTVAVFRLQHSLDRVVNRLDVLENVLCKQSVRIAACTVVQQF